MCNKLGVTFNDMLRTGELSAPVVIGWDRLDSCFVASPNRETETIEDGSDALFDWPLLNAFLNTASGAIWVCLHRGGGVSMDFSQDAVMVICDDGIEDAARWLNCVLWNNPATGVIRHAYGGYEDSKACALENGLSFRGTLGTE